MRNAQSAFKSVSRLKQELSKLQRVSKIGRGQVISPALCGEFPLFALNTQHSAYSPVLTLST